MKENGSMNSYIRIGLSAVLGICLVALLAQFEVISWGSGGTAGISAIAVATLINLLRYRKKPKPRRYPR